MITEQEILGKLKEGVVLHPLTFRLKTEQPKSSKPSIVSPDVFVEGTRDAQTYIWGPRSFTFAVEIKRYNSAKSVTEAIYTAKQTVRAYGSLWPESPGTENQIYPLIITPWLSWENLMLLENELVSGIDLCGNGAITLPGIQIRRAGQPNAYPDSRLVRNVYSGNTSLVARVFLLRPSYTSVNNIIEEIKTRDGEITQPTVSKAIRQLQEDLIISKEKKNIRLVQSDKLLERLSSEFSKPKIRQTIQFKINDAPIGRTLSDAAKIAGAKIALTGNSSVDLFTAFAQEPLVSFYCNKPLSNLLKALKEPPELDSKFPNVRLIETEDPTVYFDAKYNEADSVFTSSIVQTWLELNAGDGRQKEAAIKIKQLILENLQQQ